MSLALLLTGGWLVGSLAMWLVATQNFGTVNRVLTSPTEQAAPVLRAMPPETSRVLLRHVIPTATSAVVVQATLGMAGAILSEAALSFLGLGVQPPTASWGTMLNGGRAHLLDAPHLTLFPGVAIALLVLGLNFLGDGLRDLADPKRQGRAPI